MRLVPKRARPVSGLSTTRQLELRLLHRNFLAASPSFAHHSFAAEYDANKHLNLTGAVTKIEFMNPHAWFYVDVKDETGKVTNWAVEMGSPNALIRLGWTRNSMKIGDLVTVDGSGAKDGSTNMNARSVTLVGRKLFAGSSQGQQ